MINTNNLQDIANKCLQSHIKLSSGQVKKAELHKYHYPWLNTRPQTVAPNTISIFVFSDNFFFVCLLSFSGTSSCAKAFLAEPPSEVLSATAGGSNQCFNRPPYEEERGARWRATSRSAPPAPPAPPVSPASQSRARCVSPASALLSSVHRRVKNPARTRGSPK